MAKRDGRGCQGLRGSPSLLILHKMFLGKIVIDKIRYFVSALVYPCNARVRTENSVHKILCDIREMCFFSLKPELWGHRCLGSKLHPRPYSYPSNQSSTFHLPTQKTNDFYTLPIMLNACDFASPCFKTLDLYMCICVNPNLNYTPIKINLRKK